MKILCTGATGFLGKNLQKIAQEQFSQHEFVFLGSKGIYLLNNEETLNIIGYHEPDVILHMAAVCGGIWANQQRPADFLENNLQMGMNIYSSVECLVSTLDDFNPKIYTLGSVCAYPKFCPVPFVEENLWNGYPEETNAPYGVAKRALLMLGQTYRSQYGIGGAHFIPANLYGPYDWFNLTTSHVIPALIKKMVDAKKQNLPQVECWGTGEATREFLFAPEAARGILSAIDQGLDTPEPINLGTGQDISIKNLAQLIAKLTEYTGEIIFTGQVSDGQPTRRLDVSKAKKLFNFESNVSLEQGLKETIEYYVNV